MKNVDKLNNNAVAALRYALTVAKINKAKFVHPYHLLLGILHISNSKIVKYLDEYYTINFYNVSARINDLDIHNQMKDKNFDENLNPEFSNNIIRIVDCAVKDYGNYIDICHLFIYLLRIDNLSPLVLSNFVECDRLYYNLLEYLPNLDDEVFVNQVTIE